MHEYLRPKDSYGPFDLYKGRQNKRLGRNLTMDKKKGVAIVPQGLAPPYMLDDM